MNWFIIIAGLLYMAGAVVDLQKGDWTLAGAFVCYALANFFLACR
ncbi:MAG TPA: hypothetical protein VIG57_03370 [Candidatus Entotheonella sp.]|jgi:hypothetical protein